MEISTKSRLVSVVAEVAVGRFTWTLFRFTMLRLTSMNDASRKNMMSISGIISIRASVLSEGSLASSLTGIGNLLPQTTVIDRALSGKFLKIVSVMFRRFGQQLDVIDR